VSFKMLDTYREVLLRKDYPEELVEESISALIGTAYAAKATILITDNLKDFVGQDAETFQTSQGKTPNGTTRKLYCVIHSRPDGKELVIVHPADFVSWTERDFRISPQSIRRTFAETTKP
jgi:hypothetical protein